MTFDLLTILVFVLAGFLYAALMPPRGRGWFLFVGSALAIFWLQPPLPIRFSDFILPAATLLITVITWWAIRVPPERDRPGLERDDRLSIILLILLVFGLSLFRFVEAEYRVMRSTF